MLPFIFQTSWKHCFYVCTCAPQYCQYWQSFIFLQRSAHASQLATLPCHLKPFLGSANCKLWWGQFSLSPVVGLGVVVGTVVVVVVVSSIYFFSSTNSSFLGLNNILIFWETTELIKNCKESVVYENKSKSTFCTVPFSIHVEISLSIKWKAKGFAIKCSFMGITKPVW